MNFSKVDIKKADLDKLAEYLDAYEEELKYGRKLVDAMRSQIKCERRIRQLDAEARANTSTTT